MSSSSIRRTRLPDSDKSPELLAKISNGGISVKSFRENEVRELCERYPFTNQTIYCGEMVYEEESGPSWSSGRTIEMHFEYRSASEMFIIQLDVDVPSIENIITRINSSTPEGVKISRNLTVNREALWDFLEGADKIIDISIINEYGKEVPFDELESESREDVIGSYPVEHATVIFSHAGEQIPVQYDNGSLHVDSDWDEAREYVVQLFERDVIQA